MSFKCIIVDDDQYAIDTLESYIQQIPELYLAKSYTDPLKALLEINEIENIDFIFSGIQMPQISGIQLAESVREKTKVLIFTTNHSTYALDAFQVNANQFLLKPVSFSKFALTVNYFINGIRTSPLVGSKRRDEVLSINSNLRFLKADQKNTYHSINPDEIEFIEAAKNYVIIHGNDKYIIHMGISQMEKALGINHFIRVAKSFVIAKSAIRKIEGNLVKLKSGRQVVVGNVYRKNFMNFLNRHIIGSDSL